MSRPLEFIETSERKQGADSHFMALDDGFKVGECSLWWKSVPYLPGEILGIVGHYFANEGVGSSLLNYACKKLQSQGCTLAVGPMDGNTWRSYRLITNLGSEPLFFMEIKHPSFWVNHFQSAGFSPLSEYTSAVAADLDFIDPRVCSAECRLSSRGVSLRSLRLESLDEDLRHIYAVTIKSFQGNFLFTAINESEFMEQYRPIRGYVRPELVILAFHGTRPVGFVFAIPDYLETQRGTPATTVILKTLAVMPGVGMAGLGAVLVARIHKEAQRLGFKRVIHALMHEDNASRNLSQQYSKEFRRYALFSRKLSP